jgi:hypothetical protein
MSKPLYIATRGYLSNPLSVATRGYLRIKPVVIPQTKKNKSNIVIGLSELRENNVPQDEVKDKLIIILNQFLYENS